MSIAINPGAKLIRLVEHGQWSRENLYLFATDLQNLWAYDTGSMYDNRGDNADTGNEPAWLPGT